MSSVCLVHPQRCDGFDCLVNNQFKYHTLLPRHHGSVVYPDDDLSYSSRASSTPQSQLKVFKSYLPSILLA